LNRIKSVYLPVSSGTTIPDDVARLDSPMSLTINGQDPGDTHRRAHYSDDAINRSLRGNSPGLLSPATGADPDLRHLHGGGRQLVRACGTVAVDGMNCGHRVGAGGRKRSASAFRPHPRNHLLTARCGDNNNGNCTVTTPPSCWRLSTRRFRTKPKPYEVDMSNPFYRYESCQCILAGGAWRPARICRSTRR